MRLLVFVLLFCLSGCVFSDIKSVPCNELGGSVCQDMGDRIFVIKCKSSAVGADSVYDKCMKDIAKHVDSLGFDYFVIFAGFGDTNSEDYTMTTNQPITTYHDYNANTHSTANIYGTGRLSGYSAYGYGDSNTRLTGNSTTYVPVKNNYTITTNTYKAIYMPIEFQEIRNFNRYYNVADYNQ